MAITQGLDESKVWPHVEQHESGLRLVDQHGNPVGGVKFCNVSFSNDGITAISAGIESVQFGADGKLKYDIRG